MMAMNGDKIDFEKDFAVFILSHNRAEKIDTLNMLERCGYKGHWYIVISTDNNQIDKYKSIIPKEHLLIFDKEKVNVDTMIPSISKQRNSPVYGRQFICDYVKEKTNYKYFLMADDDVKKVVHKVNYKGKMKEIAVTDINVVIKNFVNFISCSKWLAGISPAFGAGFMGGVRSIEKVTRECFQFCFFKVANLAKYKGFREEDTLLCLNNIENVYLSFYGMAIITPIMGTGGGGNEYKEKELPPSLFPYVAHPSGIKATKFMQRIRYNKRVYPCIISEMYKKQ